jgi:Ala-tRNA(Pro) deacylase
LIVENGKLVHNMDSISLLHYLEQLNISYEYHDHVAVYTSEEARRLIPPLAGASAKNLFLRDKKGSRHFLLTFMDSKPLNIKALASSLGISNLSLASPERLKRILGVEPGAVSLLALVNDKTCQTEVLIDEDIWRSEKLQCHPLINTATIVVSLADIKKFLAETGHNVKQVKIIS